MSIAFSETEYERTERRIREASAGILRSLGLLSDSHDPNVWEEADGALYDATWAMQTRRRPDTPNRADNGYISRELAAIIASGEWRLR